MCRLVKQQRTRSPFTTALRPLAWGGLWLLFCGCCFCRLMVCARDLPHSHARGRHVPSIAHRSAPPRSLLDVCTRFARVAGSSLPAPPPPASPPRRVVSFVVVMFWGWLPPRPSSAGGPTPKASPSPAVATAAARAVCGGGVVVAVWLVPPLVV